jgi:hypothetical protein
MYQNKNTEPLLNPGNEVEKTKYMFRSCHQNAGQNYNIEMANKSLKNVSKFKHL